MHEQSMLSVYLTKDFREIWFEYKKLALKSPRFKEMMSKRLNKDGSKSRALEKGLDSMLIRFATLVCLDSCIKEKENLLSKKQYVEEEA